MGVPKIGALLLESSKSKHSSMLRSISGPLFFGKLSHFLLVGGFILLHVRHVGRGHAIGNIYVRIVRQWLLQYGSLYDDSDYDTGRFIVY